MSYRPGLRSVGLGAAVTFGTLLAASALYRRNKVTLASIWRSICSSLGLGPDKDAPRLVTVRRVATTTSSPTYSHLFNSNNPQPTLKV